MSDFAQMPPNGNGARQSSNNATGRNTEEDPFLRQPPGPEITRFVNVLAKKLRTPPPLPLTLPSEDDWLLKIIAIQDRFVLGLYRRQMNAISYLGKIEKLLGVPATTRNWNTIEKVATILRQN